MGREKGARVHLLSCSAVGIRTWRLARLGSNKREKEVVMNSKLPVRSLKEVPYDQCSGPCGIPLGTHRTVTIDTAGNPVRFGENCGCFAAWQSKNAVTGFARRSTELVAT